MDNGIDERLKSISGQLEILTGMQIENEKRIAQLTTNLNILHDSIKSLEVIAVAHEHRITRLEGPQ